MSGPLKKYRVVRNGFETVMKLSDEDAEKLGAGPYDVVGASTIEPVTLATDTGSGADDDGAPVAPGSAAAAMASAGGDVGPGAADGVPGPEPVQPPADPGDGQEQEGAQPPAGDRPEVHPAAPEPQPAPVKAPAKKRTAAANKARPVAENKAGG
ncbi:hypothetical protein [Streptomyces tauricus]